MPPPSHFFTLKLFFKNLIYWCTFALCRHSYPHQRCNCWREVNLSNDTFCFKAFFYTDISNCTLTNVTVKGGYKLGGIIGYICASNGTGDVTGNTLTDCTVDGIGNGIFAGGKTEYVIGQVVGNYDCNGTCNNNTITNMTTSVRDNIGKIEAGKTVTQ